MGTYDAFERFHGPPDRCRRPPAASLARYQGVLPDDLLREWQTAGWCSFGEGLFWTVDPGDFADLLARWLGPQRKGHAFARTAFGSILFWDGQTACFLDVEADDVTELADDLPSLFNEILCNEDVFLDPVVGRVVFLAALPRLGEPSHDECYAFTPVKALGGPGTADTLEKVKLREHLELLLQVHRG